MKCDGHAKITDAAIRRLFQKCVVDTTMQQYVCNMAEFKINNEADSWSNSIQSNSIDNISKSLKIMASQLWFNVPAINNYRGYLSEKAVAVDLDIKYVPGHWLDYGQKYHFLRIKNDTVHNAYANGCEFILSNILSWLNNTVRIKHNKHTALNSSLKQKAIEHLALALHCLQDTFSPAHVKRAHSKDVTNPGRIVDIYVYDKENKITHSRLDYRSGSLSSIEASMAVEASVALMLSCIKAAANDYYIFLDWNSFRNKWLAYSR